MTFQILDEETPISQSKKFLEDGRGLALCCFVGIGTMHKPESLNSELSVGIKAKIMETGQEVIES